MYQKIYLSLCFCLLFCFSNSIAQTQYKDVAPIFIANCTSCHHPGGIATPYTSYSGVVAMSSVIKNYIENNIMPPWPADPSYKHYVKERIIPAADKLTLINWINNGMLAGDTTLAPPLPNYTSTQLSGTPDLILSLPKFISTASSADHYYCVNVPSALTQDRYIRAFEFVPGNAAIIHHAVITIDTTGTSTDDMSGNCYNFQGQINIGDYAPGMGPTVLPGVTPTKFGFRLKAGSKLSFQIHVPEGSAGQQDSSQLRIYFYPVAETNIRPMYFETALQNWSFYVPPNDSIFATAKYPASSAGLPIPVSLFGCFPHSHKTCTSIINFAYKAADTIPLIRIPKWDFHWQMQYTFKKMVKVPNGYHLFARHKYDNTTNNPETPDPNIAVVPGYNTYDEMLFDSFLYSPYQTGDDTVDMEILLLNDPLLNPTAIFEPNANTINLLVYPNPSDQFVYFNFNLLQAQYVSLTIYDLLGNQVSKPFSGIMPSGNQIVEWDNQNHIAVAGNYVYVLQCGQKTAQGMISIK